MEQTIMRETSTQTINGLKISYIKSDPIQSTSNNIVESVSIDTFKKEWLVGFQGLNGNIAFRIYKNAKGEENALTSTVMLEDENGETKIKVGAENFAVGAAKNLLEYLKTLPVYRQSPKSKTVLCPKSAVKVYVMLDEETGNHYLRLGVDGVQYEVA